MSYVMDSVFGDGTPSQDESNPLKAFSRLFSPLLTLEILSSATDGGLANVVAPETVSPEYAPDLTHAAELDPLTMPTPKGMA